MKRPRTVLPTSRSTAPASPAVLARRRAVLTWVTGAGIIAVGAAASVASRSLGYWTDLGPGPGFFPLCLGILLVVLGVAWLVSVGRSDKDPVSTAEATPTADNGAAAVPDPAEEFPEYSLPTVVAIVLSLVVLAATLEVLGYQLAMLIFLLFHLLVLGKRRVLLSLVIAVAGSVGVFVVFTRFLTVPLPASSIPFLRDLGF